MPPSAGDAPGAQGGRPSGLYYLRWRLGLACCMVAALGTACDNGSAAPEEETIPREAFIEAYVALREVGLRAPQQLLNEEERGRILTEQGITEAELFTFVEVHGTRVEFMRDVWNEIEERLEAMRTQPDTSAASGTDSSESRS